MTNDLLVPSGPVLAGARDGARGTGNTNAAAAATAVTTTGNGHRLPLPSESCAARLRMEPEATRTRRHWARTAQANGEVAKGPPGLLLFAVVT